MKRLNYLLTFLIILIGSFLYSFALYVFTIPAKFVPGGVSGIASIIQILTNFPAGYSIFIINIPLLILAYFYLSKSFVYKTVCCVICSTFFLNLFEYTHFYTFNISEPFVTAIAGGVLTGFGVGLLVNFGVSTGGSEIIGMMIHKKATSLSISWIIFSINIVIIFIGGILYYLFLDFSMTDVIRIIIYSFFQVFMTSKSMEIMLNGFSSAVKFEIITNKSELLSKVITSQLGRGVTIIQSIGGYTKEENKTLICVISRLQVGQFKKILKRFDPNAFAYAIDTREVVGTGFTKDEMLPIPKKWLKKTNKES